MADAKCRRWSWLLFAVAPKLLRQGEAFDPGDPGIQRRPVVRVLKPEVAGALLVDLELEEAPVLPLAGPDVPHPAGGILHLFIGAAGDVAERLDQVADSVE